MAYLNLMRNRLKPKEVNDALENVTDTPENVTNALENISNLDAEKLQSQRFPEQLYRESFVYLSAFSAGMIKTS